MAKKKTKRVKRVLGLKVPKPVGRFLATNGGKALVAGAVVAGGVAASRHPRVRAAVAMAAYELKRAGASAGEALGSAARSALTPVIAAAQMPMNGGGNKGKKDRKHADRETPRLMQEDGEVSAG